MAPTLLLLSLACSSQDVTDSVVPVPLRCGPTYRVDIPNKKINPDDCWRVEGISGAKLAEVDGDCENPVSCLVTRNQAVWRVGGGNEGWEEVPCSIKCE